MADTNGLLTIQTFVLSQFDVSTRVNDFCPEETVRLLLGGKLLTNVSSEHTRAAL